MTVHEAKLIQTFPDDYRICGSWGVALRQIGNAVPVQLARQMGEQMKRALGARAQRGVRQGIARDADLLRVAS